MRLQCLIIPCPLRCGLTQNRRLDFQKAFLRQEFTDICRNRASQQKRAGAVNENLATGEIEIRAKETRILSEAETPPFPIEAQSKIGKLHAETGIRLIGAVAVHGIDPFDTRKR